MERSMYDHTFLAEEAMWWYVGKRTLWKRALASHLGAEPARILDVGCGTGGDLARLATFGVPVGTDVSLYALGFSRLREIRRLAASTAEALPFLSERFDAVLSFDAISHERVDDDDRALAEFHRVLSPGGLLLLNLPAFAFLGGQHDAVGHIDKRYTRPEVKRKVERAGFRVERITYWNTLLFLPAVAWRLRGKRRMRDGEEPSDDFFVGGDALNGCLRWVMRLEMAIAGVVDLPFGLSLFAVCTKEAAGRGRPARLTRALAREHSVAR